MNLSDNKLLHAQCYIHSGALASVMSVISKRSNIHSASAAAPYHTCTVSTCKGKGLPSLQSAPWDDDKHLSYVLYCGVICSCVQLFI
jgi:hypothetical protein